MASTTKTTRQAATPSHDHPRKLIKLPEVRQLTTLSTSEIYRRVSAGTFPKQIMLGPKSAVWIEAEVLTWLEARISQSRGEAA